MNHIRPEDFVMLDRNLLRVIYTREYSSESISRESEVKKDLRRACLEDSGRPSVETSLHDLIRYAFVVHTHPTLVNAITCAADAENTVKRFFGENALYIPYTDPGYVLFTKIRDRLTDWRKNHDADPRMIFLQNHGVFVGADTIEEIRDIYKTIETTIRNEITLFPDESDIEIPDKVVKILPALRMLLSADEIKVGRIRNNRLINYFTSSAESFSKVSCPFTPDQIVYCKAHALFLDGHDPDSIITGCSEKIMEFTGIHGYSPKIIGIKGYGIAAFDTGIKSAEIMLDVFEDWMQISYLSENFGGPNFMSDRDISFIDNWEVENYRRQVSGATSVKGRTENKIVIVTGGAQGFGEGIASGLIHEGANVMIADLNRQKGLQLAENLNGEGLKNEAAFCETDVTNPDSVQKMIIETVKRFGGLDVLISNAGVLHAGGLEEMTLETFEFITRVNYTGYFVCAAQASAIMKLQAQFKKGYLTDIIQINSKSGLKGSNRNFAYAGSKFGSIGLTQSFAMELIPWGIKVNAVCPGNFFEGPLWSHPETGLFVQYLKTGKVPGAKTLEDVKAYYERQVPAGRGCRVGDVMKAIFYIMDQEYETGQAVPVTGGQEMLR
jgi:NAD(P)-dependent dehydrogenase (short-subunit alcohol dehydrogenase family)/rhamnose utilization protein RhaD (predicted bifunctional aldolase and dehydrogenase)